MFDAVRRLDVFDSCILGVLIGVLVTLLFRTALKSGLEASLCFHKIENNHHVTAQGIMLVRATHIVRAWKQFHQLSCLGSFGQSLRWIAVR